MQKLYCIRHGTAEHNVLFHEIGTDAYMKVRDSYLMEKGHEESLELGKTWGDISNVEIVFVSPLRRTLQTALNIFKDKDDVEIIALDYLQEFPASLEHINHRQSKTALMNEFKDSRVNFSLIVCENDPYWNETIRETTSELNKRTTDFIEFIKKRKEVNIAVVSHSSFLANFLYGEITDEDNELDHCKPYVKIIE